MRTLRTGISILGCGALLLAAVDTAEASAAARARIVRSRGIVQVSAAGGGAWRSFDKLPHPLSPGDRVRTGTRASATLRLGEGSRIRLYAHATLVLEETSPRRVLMRLDLGRLRAQVKKILTRRFQIRTPTAVASVRGTEFSMSVLAGGRTFIELYRGLLGVEDNRGHQVLLHPNESLRIDRRGMNVPQRLTSSAQRRSESVRTRLKREVGLDMGQEELLAAAAQEIKLAEYQQGKALVDVHGNRVRVEEYIMRPRADQFKLVVLNSREDRFDYFYYLGTFNRTLPGDLSVALRELGGTVDVTPTYYLTGFETGRSNLSDSIRETALGGHPVDVNNNVDGGDDVQYFFDSSLDRYVDVTGRSVYRALFDDYGFYLNNRLKYGWSGTGISSYDDTIPATDTDPITGAALTASNAYLDGTGFLATRSWSVTFPDAERVNQRVYESYSDGSSLVWDNFIIDDEGRVAAVSDFAGITSGSSFRERLLKYNYEQVISATEFGGRTIDLVVEPRILIQSGLIK